MNTAESAFVDELEKISGIKEKAVSTLDRIRRRLGNRVIATGRRIRGEHEVVKNIRNGKPWIIGGAGLGGGAGLAYYLNRESKNA